MTSTLKDILKVARAGLHTETAVFVQFSDSWWTFFLNKALKS